MIITNKFCVLGLTIGTRRNLSNIIVTTMCFNKFDNLFGSILNVVYYS